MRLPEACPQQSNKKEAPPGRWGPRCIGLVSRCQLGRGVGEVGRFCQSQRQANVSGERDACPYRHAQPLTSPQAYWIVRQQGGRRPGREVRRWPRIKLCQLCTGCNISKCGSKCGSRRFDELRWHLDELSHRLRGGGGQARDNESFSRRYVVSCRCRQCRCRVGVASPLSPVAVAVGVTVASSFAAVVACPPSSSTPPSHPAPLTHLYPRPVCWDKNQHKWQASISHGGKQM